MKPKGYLIFHLNLAFSSLEEDARSGVIRNCYHPLLDLVEETGIPIGIELTGWTLEKIQRIDNDWVIRFKKLLDIGLCELIGSGYCQIIGPLVPFSVNEWNQKLGIECYERNLDRRPEIVLVNEMAFSNSLVDLYNRFGYKGLIMDWDNIKLTSPSDNSKTKKMPTHALGSNGAEMPVLWSDSILFQKVQHFVHGDISLECYLGYLNSRIIDGEFVLPIYCNDAEVFDYRPGRFSEERPIHPEGEWERIKRLLRSISSVTNVDFISPSQALKINDNKGFKSLSKLANERCPIPVKKQEKYNIARWAVTGINDIWINTMCHRIEKYLTESDNNIQRDWKGLCQLWSSDLRTHITEKRWHKAKLELHELAVRHSIDERSFDFNVEEKKYVLLEDIKLWPGSVLIQTESDGVFLFISTKFLEMKLNLRRGLAIQNLSFFSHKMEACIGTLQHGHFSDISLGADFYSGGVVVELPLDRKRVTDLDAVTPKFFINSNGDIEIYVEIKSSYGVIIKIITVSVDSEKISLKYRFKNWGEIIGSVRLGTITFLNEFSANVTKLKFSNGGINDEEFDLCGDIDHIRPASTLVSSSLGLGATKGKITALSNNKKIKLEWDPAECAAMPMLKNVTRGSKVLSRIFFSVKEFDDTVKLPTKISSFSLTISTET